MSLEESGEGVAPGHAADGQALGGEKDQPWAARQPQGGRESSPPGRPGQRPPRDAQAPEAGEDPPQTGQEDDSMSVIDAQGRRYTRKEVLDIVLGYKRDSRNFFWGDLQRRCNKMSRRQVDGWYDWTREMMEGIDKNEAKMRNIVSRHSHSKIQRICKSVGGDQWCLNTEGKLKRLVGGLRQIEKLIKSEHGMSSCWGRLRYAGVFKRRISNKRLALEKRVGKGRAYDALDYVEYRAAHWGAHFRNVAEKDDLSKLQNDE